VESWAITRDGVRLFVRAIGEGDQVVIIPGAAWLERELEKLAAPERKLVFYDTQSRGNSDAGPTGRLTFDNEVDDLEVVRRHVGAERVGLVGWSYLGAVVALYASRFPDHVTHLALLCPMAARRGPFPGMQPYRQLLEERSAAIAAQRARLRVEAEADPSPERWRAYGLLNASIRMGNPASADAVLADPWQYPQEWAPRVEQTLEALFESLDDFDWRPDMAVVGAPALVVHGDLDGPLDVIAEWAASFPNGQLLRLADTGHFPFVEQRERLLVALNDFLSGSAAAPQP